MDRRTFAIEDIHIGPRHRQPNMAKVAKIAESIKDSRLLHIPAVCMRDNVLLEDGEISNNVPVLIFGRHRILALQENGETVVECAVYDVDDLQAELMEIDENLARSELSQAEEAAHIRRRQELWEDIHGPAKAVGARAANAVMGKGDASPNFSVAFTTDTAAATGKASSSIRLAAQRGRELGSDIHRIVGTSLDKGVEIDALVKLPKSERADLIRRAEAGEKVSARPVKERPVSALEAMAVIKMPDDDRKAAQRQRFWDMWASLDDDVRQEISAVIAARAAA